MGLRATSCGTQTGLRSLRLYGLRTGGQSEVVVQFPIEALPDTDLLSEARLMVLATTNPNHVVLYSREYPGFLLYDNDSGHRLGGEGTRIQSEHMPTRGHATATTERGSHLHSAVLEMEAWEGPVEAMASGALRSSGSSRRLWPPTP